MSIHKWREFIIFYLKYCLLLKWNWTNPLHTNITEIELNVWRRLRPVLGLLSFLVVISVGLSFFPACFHPCFVQQLSPALSCFADVPLRTRTSLGQDWACSCGKGLSPNVFGPESPDEQEASSLPLPRGTWPLSAPTASRVGTAAWQRAQAEGRAAPAANPSLTLIPQDGKIWNSWSVLWLETTHSFAHVEEKKKIKMILLMAIAELEENFLSPLKQQTHLQINGMQQKDKHLIKDQGIKANTNENLHYLIVVFQAYFLHIHLYFISTREDEILLN